jgi:hypothetical protein
MINPLRTQSKFAQQTSAFNFSNIKIFFNHGWTQMNTDEIVKYNYMLVRFVAKQPR